VLCVRARQMHQRAWLGASHGCKWDQHGILIVFTFTGRREEFPARGAWLLPSLCTRSWAARGSDLRWVARGSDSRSCTASRLVLRRVCGCAGVAPDSCPRSAREGGGARLRLMLARLLAACTAAARLRLERGVWRPDSWTCSTREGRRRAAHPHSRTSSRLVLLRRVCGLSSWRPTLARAAAAEAVRGSDLRSRVASRVS